MKYSQRSTLISSFKALVVALLFAIYSQAVLADKIDDFIQKVHVATYDCPDDQYMPQVSQYLKRPDVSPKQQIDLKVHRAHWLICVGKYQQAQSMLEQVALDPAMDKQSQSFAYLNYQLGFIFDVQEKPEKCDFYRKAEQLAKDKFNDVHLSSQLGLITVCGEKGGDVGVKLGRSFALLKYYSLKEDQKAVAHIHNSIGILFSDIGQRALAAEQHEKAYKLGLTVYEEKNQLAPLISMITAYTGSGDYENAKLVIEELGRRNLEVNTPLTNSWYHYAKSRQAYYTKDYAGLRKSLGRWWVFLEQTSDSTMDKMYQWYAAALCLHDGDKTCVEAYMQRQNDTQFAMPAKLSRHLQYNGFLVEAHLFLGEIDAAQEKFENYSSIALQKINSQQTSARILGVANLHSEIIDLEADLASEQAQRLQIIIVVIVGILSLLCLAYFTVGRSYLRKLATDPVTGLTNEHSVVTQIKKVKMPTAENVNALALFEVSSLTAVNVEYGYQAGELALKQVAECLKHVTREKDIVGRVGADQFIVCLVNIEDSVAKELFSRLEEALSDVQFEIGSGEKIKVATNMHLYSAVTSLADADDVLAEIRNVLRKPRKTP